LSKIAAIQNKIRGKSSENLLNQSIEFIPSPTKQKKEKETKKSTFEVTLELLHEGKDCEEIARERQLSTNTINTHFIQLIKAEKIRLEDVMEQKRINEISDLLADSNLNSLSKIKEQVGSEISWEELKLYQASTII
jgi:uncharacterized protein YpbB